MPLPFYVNLSFRTYKLSIYVTFVFCVFIVVYPIYSYFLIRIFFFLFFFCFFSIARWPVKFPIDTNWSTAPFSTTTRFNLQFMLEVKRSSVYDATIKWKYWQYLSRSPNPWNDINEWWPSHCFGCFATNTFIQISGKIFFLFLCFSHIIGFVSFMILFSFPKNIRLNVNWFYRLTKLHQKFHWCMNLVLNDRLVCHYWRVKLEPLHQIIHLNKCMLGYVFISFHIFIFISFPFIQFEKTVKTVC